jgi:hypothetical protein
MIYSFQVWPMDIAREIAKFEERGFTRERAEVNALMEQALVSIFKDFPDAYVLIGGASLVLYHESARHSADLDLLARKAALPSCQEVTTSLERALVPMGQVMGLGALTFQVSSPQSPDGKIFVFNADGQQLFRVDLTGFGSVIESEIQNHSAPGSSGSSSIVRSVTKELLQLQKGETFLTRRFVKARDAYDIYLLRNLGATLNRNLQAHLHDTILGNGFDADSILERINQISSKACVAELKPILPPEIYSPLEEKEFEPLRDALQDLYQEWL